MIFTAIFVGYAVYSLNRKSFTYLLAFILEDTNLDKKDLGELTSTVFCAHIIQTVTKKNGMLKTLSVQIHYCFFILVETRVKASK